MAIPTVTYAKFRVADPVADAAAYPNNNLLWRLAKAPFETAVKVACTVKLLWYGGDALQAGKPEVLECMDRISGYLGIYPECQVISYFPTFLMGNYIISRDPRINAALFDHHRGSLSGSGLFTRGFSAGALLGLIREIFNDPEIGDNDMMLTCSEQFTKEYREWLHQMIGPISIRQYNDHIKNEAESTLDSWISQCKQGKAIDLRRMGQYASRVLTSLVFSSREGSDEISEALNDINWFILCIATNFLDTNLH